VGNAHMFFTSSTVNILKIGQEIQSTLSKPNLLGGKNQALYWTKLGLHVEYKEVNYGMVCRK